MLRVRPTTTSYKDQNQSPAASAARRENERQLDLVIGCAALGGMAPAPEPK